MSMEELEHESVRTRAKQRKEFEKEEPSTLELFSEFLRICIPACIARFCLQTEFICLIIATQFNDTEKMAGIGLAISIMAVLGTCAGGIAQPVETLTAHAHGLGDLRLCGLYLNRTILVVVCTYLIILVGAFTLLF